MMQKVKIEVDTEERIDATFCKTSCQDYLQLAGTRALANFKN